MVLYHDYAEIVTIDAMVNNNLEYLLANVDYYKQFHVGDLSQYADGYFKFGNYCDSIIDVIIIATVKALHVNLPIYQKEPEGNIELIEQTIDTGGREVYLKFMQAPTIQCKTTMMSYYALPNLVRYVIKTDIT